MLTPYLEQNGVEIKEVLVGVMTGQAMDMMEEKDIRAESAYFLPSLEVWLNERDCYPFIGGDSLDNAHNTAAIRRSTWSCPMSSRLSSARATATPTTYTP